MAGAFQRGGFNCTKSQNFRQSEIHTSDLPGVTMNENEPLSNNFSATAWLELSKRGGSNCAKSQNFRQSENHTSDLSGVTINENEPLSNNFSATAWLELSKGGGVVLMLGVSSQFTQNQRIFCLSDVDSIRFRTFQSVYLAT